MNEQQFDEAYAQRRLRDVSRALRMFRDLGLEYQNPERVDCLSIDIGESVLIHKMAKTTGIAEDLDNHAKSVQTFEELRQREPEAYQSVRTDIMKFHNDYHFRG